MLLPLFEWCQESAATAAITQSTWLVSVVELLHLLGLTVLVGSVVVVSLRLFGLAMTSRPVSEVAGDLWRWTLYGLAMQLTSGVMLFTSEAVRWYHSGPFLTKMTLLLLALLFHFTTYRRVTRRDDLRPVVYRLTGALALTLWFSVGLAGRAITNL
jgi:hypothetical protein